MLQCAQFYDCEKWSSRVDVFFRNYTDLQGEITMRKLRRNQLSKHIQTAPWALSTSDHLLLAKGVCENQAGFLPIKISIDQILTSRQILEHAHSIDSQSLSSLI